MRAPLIAAQDYRLPQCPHCRILPNMPPILPSLTVNILLFETFSNMLLACLLEPLRVVRDEVAADIRWTILTHTDAPTLSSSGLRITPDTARAKAKPCDMLIVIGGDNFRADARDSGLRQSLNLTKTAETVIAADTGTWLLAAAGYLDGRRATLHWQLLVEFAEAFPKVRVLPDRYVQHGPFLTCGGASTALDLILAQISQRFGQTAKFDAAAMFLHDLARPVIAPEADLSPHRGLALRKALTLMAANLERPLSLQELALQSGITLRSMARLFEAQVGMPPGRYYQHLRLARAKDLSTHTGLPLSQIALRCGFSGASSLSRAFLQSHGTALGAATRPRH
ncbi:MAG: helix-turn-helix domain-containing protein [Paracoccaceae bacterium]